MNQNDREIFGLFAACVGQRFDDAWLWAFGSRGRRGAGWDSDFDICVVVDRLDAEADQALSDLAWEVGFAHDRVITIIPFSRDGFERGLFSESSLVETIRREGIAA